MKQNITRKIYFVIYIAGFFFNKKFCYEVIAKQKKKSALLITTHMCLFSFRGGEYPKDGYMAVGSFLFLKEQIKGIIIKSAIAEKNGDGDWANVRSPKNLRDGSRYKDANGKNVSKGMLYENLRFKDRMKAPWHVSDQASEQKSRKRKAEPEAGGQATRPSENSADVREKNKLSTIRCLAPQDLPLALPLEDYAAVFGPHPPVLSQFDQQGVAEYIRTKDCRNIIVMAGAGIPVSAGIPDFHAPGTGLYDNLAKYNLPEPAAVFNIDFFRQNQAPFCMLAKELFPGQYKPTPTLNFIRLLSYFFI